MRNKPTRIIIDTNLWISFIISNRISQLEPLLISKKIKLLFSKQLIDEIDQTIKKPKLIKYFEESSIERMLSVFDPYINLIEVSSHITTCRDSRDNFLLELAKDGNADFLVTGDNNLLILKESGCTEILKMSEFLIKVNEI